MKGRTVFTLALIGFAVFWWMHKDSENRQDARDKQNQEFIAAENRANHLDFFVSNTACRSRTARSFGLPVTCHNRSGDRQTPIRSSTTRYRVFRTIDSDGPIHMASIHLR